MSCRAISLSMALALSVLVASTAVAGAAPAGPRLGIARLGFAPIKIELLTVGATGGEALVMAGGGKKVRPVVEPNSRFAWSPDGSSILFAGYAGNPGARGARTELFLVGADGGSPRLVPRTKGARSPVIAPDGHTFAFARERARRGDGHDYESVTVWLGDLGGGVPRRITPWRNRLRQDPSSFSADSKTLAVTRLVADKTPEAIGLELDGSADSVLVRNAIEPVFSPDGSQLAFLRGAVRRSGNTTARVTDLYVKDSGGGGLKRLTKTSRALEYSPSWDPSGQRLAWIEWNPFPSEAAFFGIANKLMQANTDGTCLTKTLSYRRAGIYAAEWQPGPGREAGPIVC